MTDTIQLAKECGARIDDDELNYKLGGDACIFTRDELEAFRKRIEDEMKERCAVKCDEVYSRYLAHAIRSMK